MTAPVFVDANVPIYLGGADTGLARTCEAILQLARRNPGACCSNAEVLQEVLHFLRRRGPDLRARATVVAFDLALSGQVEPVTREDVLRAMELDLPAPLQVRDRVHLAMMERLGISRIITVDTAFDAAPGIERLDPRELAAWREPVFSAGA